MTYLSLFTIPKGFVDPHVTLIQRNALASWSRLADVEVLVMGDDPGVADAAREFGAIHVDDATTNEHGTPLLDWAFRQARERGSGDLLCYVNADIALLGDFVAALRQLTRRRYLAIGQRWDCDVRRTLDFASDPPALRNWARQQGKLDACTGSDYFAYPRDVDFGMPAFAVGRPGWDNWLIGRALAMGLPVVDLTPSVTVIHQNHDYGHVAQRKGSDWEGPEADRNRQLAGWLDRYKHTPANATHVLSQGRLHRALAWRNLRARAAAFVALRPAGRPFRKVVEAVTRVMGERATRRA
jgi:hypothetical protein